MKVECIVMAGGRATRMGGVEKPLLDVCGVPIVVRVVRTLSEICRKTYIIYSKWTRGVVRLCGEFLENVVCVEGKGEDYVEDLNTALSLTSFPVLILPADTPFLSSNIIRDFVAKAMLNPKPIANLLTERGLTGISLFKEGRGPWVDIVIKDPSLIDVDTWDDYKEAVMRC